MRWSSIAVLMTCCCCVYAQQMGSIEHPQHRLLRFENGLIISWGLVSEDASMNQVEIFDEQGHPVVSLNVLRPVQEAKRVSIYDVSARPGAVIAVAAVYSSKEGNQRVRPAAMLLLFDFGGRLLSAVALEPWRQISRLAVDDNSNIWTLTAHADDKDPSTIPMVVEYRADGTVARELLSRSLFPLHAATTKENSTIGSPSMGYDSGGLWFWLPGSTELVTVQAGDETPAMMKTGLPREQGSPLTPMNVVRESSGNVVAEVRLDEDNGKKSQLAYYRWSSATKIWLRFKPASCDGDWLVGVANKEQIFVRHEAGRTNICVSAE